MITPTVKTGQPHFVGMTKVTEFWFQDREITKYDLRYFDFAKYRFTTGRLKSLLFIEAWVSFPLPYSHAS